MCCWLRCSRWAWRRRTFEARGFLERQAQDQVLREAGLMAASASATRIYTEEMVTPYLAKAGEQDGVFLPQTIPFFATTTIFGKIQQQYPDYTYKEAALNPTNLRDRATDWEADLIQHFRDSPKDTELIRTRDSATGPSLYLAHPVRVEQGCLQCHSQPAVAPKTMLAKYGDRNGFGWNLGEVVGAQIVAVPTSLPLELAHRGLQGVDDRSVRDLPGGDSADRCGALCNCDSAAADDLETRQTGSARARWTWNI